LGTRNLHLPLITTRYYSRPLNISTFLESSGYRSYDCTQYSSLEQKYSLSEYRSGDVRKVSVDDMDTIYELLQKDSEKYVMSTMFTKEDIAQRFLPKEDILHSFLFVDSTNGQIQDFLSFYCLDYIHKESPASQHIKVAYLFHYTTTVLSPRIVLETALKLAKENGCDEFKLIAVGDVLHVLEDEDNLLFEKEIQYLYFYLFNMQYPVLCPDQCKFVGIE